MRVCLALLALLTAGSLSASAFAQATPQWWNIACAHSKISVPAGLTCRTTQNFSGFPNSDDGQGTYRNWTASGVVGGVEYFYLLTEVTSRDRGLTPTKSLQDTIRLEMLPSAQPSGFSALTNRGGADYITYATAQGASCVSVRRYGPSATVGYQWILYAVRCQPQGGTVSDAEIDRLIAGTTVRGS